MNMKRKVYLKDGQKQQEIKYKRDLYSAFLIKNVKENLEEVNIEKAKKEFKNFVKLHNKEMERIKKVMQKH